MNPNKHYFNKICIVGVGLIGGSLGLAIKKRRLAKFVVGVVRRKRSAIEAVQKKAVDRATLDLKEGVRGADLVILAGPIPAILSQMKVLPKYISENTMVLDAGSSKSEIDHAARRFKKMNFVGCHPMAGSEHTGVGFADEDLFENVVCFMTRKNKKAEAFWKSLGAKPILISASRHDAWVAMSSHLPHLISFSLFQNIRGRYPYNPSLKSLARLADSNAELWADIFLSNQKEISKAAYQFQKGFAGFQKALRAHNRKKLVQLIRHANKRSL